MSSTSAIPSMGFLGFSSHNFSHHDEYFDGEDSYDSSRENSIINGIAADYDLSANINNNGTNVIINSTSSILFAINSSIFNSTTIIADDNSTKELETEGVFSSASTIVLVIVLSMLIIATIVGNVLVCTSVILVKKLRHSKQNYLLVSLALSDLFVALFVMPFCIALEVHGGQWPLNDALCDLWVSADVLCCTASILNLCGISLDRYRAITSPLEYSAKTTPKRMMAIIFVVWLLSACVSLPPVLLLGNVHMDTHGGSFCSVSQNFWYQIYATMASFYVPLCVMVVVYVKILRVVADKKKQMSWKHQSLHRTSSSTTASNSTHSAQPLLPPKKDSGVGLSPLIHNKGTSSTTTTSSCNSTVALNAANNVVTSIVNNNNKAVNGGPYYFPTGALHRIKRKEKAFGGLKEHKASTVLGIIMSAFVVCWLPFFILAIMRPFLTINNVEIPPWVSSLFNWLGYANSALNPLIYATLNRDFRRPFKEILCFRCATLDSLMRKEFYQQQYGDDKDNLARRASRAHIHVHAPPEDSLQVPVNV